MMQLEYIQLGVVCVRERDRRETEGQGWEYANLCFYVLSCAWPYIAFRISGWSTGGGRGLL